MKTKMLASNILVVEDEKEVQEDIKMMLSSFGYRNIDCVDNAASAIRMISKKDYAVTLLDIGLPGRINGLRLLEIIKSRAQDTEAIMLTAWNETQNIIEATKKGAFYYLTKDRDVEKLPDILELALELRILRKNLNEKAREMEDIFLNDKRLFDNEFNIEYLSELLLDKIFDSVENVLAAGITNIEDQEHFWKQRRTTGASVTSMKYKRCEECNKSSCFSSDFDEGVPISIPGLSDEEPELICENLVETILDKKSVKERFYLPLSIYDLDGFDSGEVAGVPKAAKEKRTRKKCIYYLWILFAEPFKKMPLEKEQLIVNFFQKIGLVLKNLYNLKKRLNKQLEVETYKKAATLMAGIPHDITPLLSKLTANINEDDGEYKEDSLRILRKIRKLLQSYGDYRNTIQQAQYDFRQYDLREILENAVATSYFDIETEQRPIEIDVKYHGFSMTRDYGIVADEIQLERAFRNLIMNAEQAILLTSKRKGLIKITLQKVENGYEVRIRDNGVGFPKSRTDNPFSDFFTTKRDGIGLGLNIANEAIEMHYGKLRLNKKLRSGTEFICTLPFRPPDLTAVPTPI